MQSHHPECIGAAGAVAASVVALGDADGVTGARAYWPAG